MRTLSLFAPSLVLGLAACSPVVIGMKGDGVIVDDTGVVDSGVVDTGGIDTADSGDTGALAPALVVPTEIDVGNALVGETVSAAFLVGNEGTAALEAALALDGASNAFAIDLTGVNLAPGEDVTVTVTFTADAEGEVTGGIDLTSNDPAAPTASIVLRARGVTDADGDGDAYDCDDTDATIFTGAPETWYDGVDQDCSGTSDYDQDGDGNDSADYGGDDCLDTDATFSPDAPEVWYDGLDQACDGGSDYDQDGDGRDSVDFGGDDCLDTDAAAFPGAPDTWYDGVDSNCDLLSDYDQDGDGADDATYGGTDCLDTDASVGPGMPDVPYDGVDGDCSGTSDFDADGDGYDALVGGGLDCDDVRADVNPGATDVPYDGIDTNCDGRSDFDGDGDGQDAAAYGGTDCDDSDASIFTGAPEAWYDGVDQDCAGTSDYDQDGDGVDVLGVTGSTGTDCDDLDASISPLATEIWYDGDDQDCSGTSDYDQDGDGYEPTAYGGTDCDDVSAGVNPGALEVWYDGIDGDCSGGSDYDQDGDGQTASAYGGTDCNDRRADIYVGATETWYDGVDQDCSGGSDYDQDADGVDAEGYGGLDCDDTSAAISPLVAETWYDGLDSDCDRASDYDQDGDGQDADAYGGLDCLDILATAYVGASEVWYDGIDEACNGGSDYDQDGDGQDATAYGGLDCLDTASAVRVGAMETCDGLDNDCDGSVDEGVSVTTYRDADGDTYGDPATGTLACSVTSGRVTTNTDCNDATSAVRPGAAEICDLLDNDCDGVVDEGLATTTWYTDADGDGYGVTGSTVAACARPSGTAASGGDCDDTRSTRSPGLAEVAYDELDNDCDSIQDEMLAATESGWQVRGSTASDGVGTGQVGSAPDLDGDGNTELVIGSPGVDSFAGEGMVTFHDSGTRGTNTAWDAGWFRVVESGGADFGVTWAYAGFGYMSVGAPLENGSGTDRGFVYTFNVDGTADRAAFYGYTWTSPYYLYSSFYTGVTRGYVRGSADNGWYGYDVASADFDGDGYQDLIASAPNESSNRGRVFVTGAVQDSYYSAISGDTDSTWYWKGISGGDNIGQSVAAGDFDGDGKADVVVCGSGIDGSSGRTDAGTCYVLRGTATTASRTDVAVNASTASGGAVATIAGAAAYDGIGSSRHSLATGDFDGDGRTDLAIGAPGYDGASASGGGVAIFTGASLTGSLGWSGASWIVRGDGGLGTSVALGDLTGDGVADLLSGAPTAASTKGVVYLFAGGSTAGTYTFPASQYASWTGAASADALGTSVGGFQDLDADGLADFVAGAPQNDNGATSNTGRAYVLRGY